MRQEALALILFAAPALPFGEQRNETLILEKASYLSVQVLHGNAMVFLVIRSDTVSRDDDIKIALIRIDCLLPHAGVSIDTRQNQSGRS